MIFLKKCALIVFTLFLSFNLEAEKKEKCDWGRLNGCIDVNSGYYLKDTKLGIIEVDDPFAINTYVNLGYNKGYFRAGLQYELYEPPVVGYSPNLEGNKLIQGFIEYQRSRFGIRVGNSFEQFGSGLILRCYEDRMLGFNNSLMGVNFNLKVSDWLNLKGVVGKPRKYLDYTDTWVYGVDAEVDLFSLFGKERETMIQLGGSWVLRDDKNESHSQLTPEIIRLYAGRINISSGFFSFGAEYVTKSNALLQVEKMASVEGSALLLNFGLDFPGIGFSGEFRRIENMGLRIDDCLDQTLEFTTLNYIPALTKQHKYMLASLYPYEVKGLGEIGGQIDLFGEIYFGESNPLSFALNGSAYRMLTVKDSEAILDNREYEFMNFEGSLLFGEWSIELERSWNKKIKSILAYIHQEKGRKSSVDFGTMDIVVGDILYKFTPKTSVRMEAQHMWSDSDKDQAWIMGLCELSFAPKWMIYGYDLYNYKTTFESIHYYNVGVSFAWNTLRTSLGYGRNRAGMQCSGGICRMIPEYTGFNLLLSLTL